jgi:hypothetical protein
MILCYEEYHVPHKGNPIALHYAPDSEPILPPPQTPAPTLPPSAVSESATHSKWEILLRDFSNNILLRHFPFQEASGPKGSVHVHVSFSLSDIQQCREKLGTGLR